MMRAWNEYARVWIEFRGAVQHHETGTQLLLRASRGPRCTRAARRASAGTNREDVVHQPLLLDLVHLGVADDARTLEHLVCRLEDALEV